MKMVRVAINGFGRIGRAVFRQGFGDEDLEFVAVNDMTDAKTLAHLLKYDSVHGKYGRDVTASDDSIYVDGKEIKVLKEKNPSRLPWKTMEIDVVVESTGRFTARKDAYMHVSAGAKKVVISTNSSESDPAPAVVLGVSDSAVLGDSQVIDNASCTTNGLMPIMRVLHENFGVKRAFMSTIHAYTNDQMLLDLPHKDLRRARAAGVNIIPTTTGAARAAGRVMPELKGMVDGIAVRVPVADGSLVDLVAELEKDTTIEEINDAMKDASQGCLEGILEYSEEPLVSSDIIGNRHSAIFDAKSTMVIGGNFIKVLAWYDNEAGFSQRLVDILKKSKGCPR